MFSALGVPWEPRRGLVACVLLVNACVYSDFGVAIGTTASGGVTNSGGATVSSSKNTGGVAGSSYQGGAQSTAGSPTTGGMTSGTGGSTILTCSQLADAYSTELAVAKQCDASATTAQCTTILKAAIPCACSTFVNRTQAAAIANLSNYANAFSSQNCVSNCPAIACVTPPSATCTRSTSSGAAQCVDGASTP